ncbi:S41 family peptidase [Schleiferia thermophila]|jgi:carboxyl-terminal processing protease|uniref:S41A family C-terminal processing peptidase-3 n=2 Tax=Schleiferia thermophila TaxID=884107 RepID=A0A368ZYD6_9FLAO|nr:S41 family peptidase [Schleiferia thermophila]KFD38801.1 peptidase S41 [Schleiferia thermophila str. Yellowstone]PMB36583.1 peptidase S41 [Fischerella thermalis CCMEE 5319]RCX01945.1 S41A family C-terminal processing peptidase-3 [Schleiferia thermophila]GCD79749.1 peptidase S41 [Schleiferia thermophila]
MKNKHVLRFTVVALFLISATSLNYFEIHKQLDIFSHIFKEINLYYVDETDPAKLMDKAIQSMLSSLDPYTTYIKESEIENFRIQTTGQYGGIGASIRKREDYVMVVSVYKDAPADKAGVRPGDLLLAIDDKSLKGFSDSEVSALLKGSPGTQFTLKVQRGDRILDLKINREEIQLKAVPYCGYVAPGIGYINLTNFTDKASKEIKDALTDLQKNADLKGVILDLRGNPGGLLSEAINVSNIFIPKGQEIVSTRGKIKEWERSYRTLDNPVNTDVPLVVLINRGSASASEIVSGAVQDLDRGVVIGQRSFGKGLVQQTRKLSYGAQLKVTVSKYYTPSGRCIQAINYSQRNEDGSVSSVADSLRRSFTTRNGRTVYDGGGIDPDIVTEPRRFSPILSALIQNNLIFDWVTLFVDKKGRDKIDVNFRLSDNEWTAFKNWLKDKEVSYQTRTEKLLSEIVETTKDEQYFVEIENELNKLKKRFQRSKEDDVEKNKQEIVRYLEEEIVSRAQYQEGRIQKSLTADHDVAEAIRVLTHPDEYRKILNP